MTVELHKPTKRKTLPARREPYWARVNRGEYIGFRKIDDERGSWIARRRDEDTRKQNHKALGFDSPTFGFDEARHAASEWFKSQAAGIGIAIDAEKIVTVADACRRWVTYLQGEGAEDNAHDAHRRFERTVYGRRNKADSDWRIKPHPVAAIRLDKLRMKHLTDWRAQLKLSPGAKDRTMTPLRAALNRAVVERNVTADRAIEWSGKSIKKVTKGGGNRRDIYLDRDQRNQLINAATSDAFRDFLIAFALTGARAGELVTARCSQFDERTRVLQVRKGKTGYRDVPLAPSAVAHFKKLSKGKLPSDYLLTREDDKPWAHSDWDELVRAAAKTCGFPSEPKKGVCLYTLRHSWITQSLMDGMRTLTVARLVGTSVQMIEKHYGHLVTSDALDQLANVTLL